MSRYRTLRFRITGAAPLLMHNGRLADPLDEHARAMARVADKRPKTEADHLRLAELELIELLADQAAGLSRRLRASGMGFRGNIVGTGADDATDAIDRRVEFKVEACRP